MGRNQCSIRGPQPGNRVGSMVAGPNVSAVECKVLVTSPCRVGANYFTVVRSQFRDFPCDSHPEVFAVKDHFSRALSFEFPVYHLLAGEVPRFDSPTEVAVYRRPDVGAIKQRGVNLATQFVVGNDCPI